MKNRESLKQVTVLLHTSRRSVPCAPRCYWAPLLRGLVILPFVCVPSLTAQTVTILPNYNITFSSANVVHLGDNPNDSRFIPPSPSGSSWTESFTLNQIPAQAQVKLAIDVTRHG